MCRRKGSGASRGSGATNNILARGPVDWNLREFELYMVVVQRVR